MRARAADLGDVVPDDGAVDVVGAGLEHELRHAERLHDPERLDVREVVEHQPRDRERAQILEARGTGEVLELAVIGEEGEGDDGLEVARKASRHRAIEASSGRLRRRRRVRLRL